MTEPTQDVAAAGDPVDEQALDAACAVLTREMRDYAPLRHMVAEALAAAHQVYAGADAAHLEDLLDQTGFGGLEIDHGVKIRIRHAAQIAQAMVASFDALLDTGGAENYTEWSTTITDPATRLALDAGLPYDQIPPHRCYKVIIVRPGKPTPHQLRQEAEAKLATALAVVESLVADEPCELDHDGDCQAHGHFSPDPDEKCPHAVARGLLAGD